MKERQRNTQDLNVLKFEPILTRKKKSVREFMITAFTATQQKI